MIRFLLAAPRSGSGKTTMACALLASLQRQGRAPCAFKCGPDYIDPMFHRAVLGVESHNLDLFFSSPETVRTLYAQGAAGHGAAVCEGAMGFYDGLGGVTPTASAWHLADTLGLPVLLVLRPKGASLTLAALVQGLQNFRKPSHIAGILLNDCKPALYNILAPMLEAETGLPVLGYLPPLPEVAIASRHLGLYTAAEVDDLQQKLSLLADAAADTLDWPRLLALCEGPARRRKRETKRRRRSKLPWRRTKRSALPTPKRWRRCKAPGPSWSFLAPCRMQPCRRASVGSICPAATRSSTPPPSAPTKPCCKA